MRSPQRFQRLTVRRQNNHRIGGQPGHRNFPSQLPIRHATAPPIRLLFCCRKAASLILPSYLHARRSRNFRSAVLAVANMLSELRKYRVGFSIAHQYLHQLEPDIRHAVLGNVGTMISFRIGAEDSPYMIREFAGYFEEIDLLQLPNHRVYLKLMIEGSPSKPFSAVTLRPEPRLTPRLTPRL